VREGRRREFQSFDWIGEVPDPQAEDTFEASRPGWERAESPPGARLRALYRDLLRLRRAEAALRPAEATVRVRNDDALGWIAVRYARVGDDTEAEVLEGIFNLSSASRVVPLDATRRWSVVLSTDAPGYGGAGEAAVEQGLRVPGHTAVLLRGAAA
jgi:maltooligosyltrehalose trehalohydrolase